MSYATLDELRAYLRDSPVDGAQDELFTSLLTRATDIVDTFLEFSFAGYTTATTKKVFGGYTEYLALPPHQLGSVSAVTLSGAAITDWEELESGSLWLDGSDWGGERYSVTANWGHGEAPQSVVEVVLEITVNLWRSREAGRFSDVVGVFGEGAVGYEKALTGQQKMVLEKIKRRFQPVIV